MLKNLVENSRFSPVDFEYIKTGDEDPYDPAPVIRYTVIGTYFFDGSKVTIIEKDIYPDNSSINSANDEIIAKRKQHIDDEAGRAINAMSSAIKAYKLYSSQLKQLLVRYCEVDVLNYPRNKNIDPSYVEINTWVQKYSELSKNRADHLEAFRELRLQMTRQEKGRKLVEDAFNDILDHSSGNNDFWTDHLRDVGYYTMRVDIAYSGDDGRSKIRDACMRYHNRVPTNYEKWLEYLVKYGLKKTQECIEKYPNGPALFGRFSDITFIPSLSSVSLQNFQILSADKNTKKIFVVLADERVAQLSDQTGIWEMEYSQDQDKSIPLQLAPNPGFTSQEHNKYFYSLTNEGELMRTLTENNVLNKKEYPLRNTEYSTLRFKGTIQLFSGLAESQTLFLATLDNKLVELTHNNDNWIVSFPLVQVGFVSSSSKLEVVASNNEANKESNSKMDYKNNPLFLFGAGVLVGGIGATLLAKSFRK